MALVKRETVYWPVFLRDLLKSQIERLVHFHGPGPLEWAKTVHRNLGFLVSRFPLSRGPLKGATYCYATYVTDFGVENFRLIFLIIFILNFKNLQRSDCAQLGTLFYILCISLQDPTTVNIDTAVSRVLYPK